MRRYKNNFVFGAVICDFDALEKENIVIHLQIAVKKFKDWSKVMESVIELLEEYGEVSAELREKIMSETDMEILKVWHKLAAKTESIEQFVIDAKNV